MSSRKIMIYSQLFISLLPDHSHISPGVWLHTSSVLLGWFRAPLESSWLWAISDRHS